MIKRLIVLLIVLCLSGLTQASAFSDLRADHFAFDAAQYLAEEGILNGYDDGSFKPDQPITRAEATKIAVEIAAKTGRISANYLIGSSHYEDISEDQWYWQYVMDASRFGLVEGYKDTSGRLTGFFGPGDHINRAASSKILFTAAHYPKISTAQPGFLDVERGAWYESYVTWAYNLTMVDGYRSEEGVLIGAFGPDDAVTRGQFAKMAYRALYPIERLPRDDCSLATASGAVMSEGSGTTMIETGSVLAEDYCSDPIILSCTINPNQTYCETLNDYNYHETVTMNQVKFLERYPFSDPEVEIIEGFLAYDGNLGDDVGAAHRGIDYAKRGSQGFEHFDVLTMHAGYAAQGTSSSWGRYVILFYPRTINGLWYATLYSHLDDVPAEIPWYQPGSMPENYHYLSVASYVGIASITGQTNNLNQLHMEVLEFEDGGTSKARKKDLYGLNERLSTGNYPNVGESLSGLSHYWTTNLPPVVTE